MILVEQILECKEILPYLEKHGLLNQYKKAKTYILSGKSFQARLKKRQPKKDSIWYFRINKKYRAIGYIDNDNSLIIVEIDDQQ